MIKVNKTIVCYDPGVNGGFAWKDHQGGIHAAAMPTAKLDGKPLKGKAWSKFQVGALSHILCTMTASGAQYYIEHVGARPSDTPKTSYGLSANYHIALTIMNIYRDNGDTVKQVPPAYWQNQLQITLPSGQQNYDLRKRLLYDFAHLKYPEVTTHTFIKNGAPAHKSRQAKPTYATADALCMLWVFSGDE